MFKRLLIAVVVLALIGGSLIGYNLFRDRLIGTIFANLPEDAMPVTTVTVAPIDWLPELSAIGTVNASKGVELTVEGAGIVRSVDFSANETVEEGQVLLTLDNETQLADLEAAKTQLALTQTSLERARRLQARGVTAEANLETTEANARAASAQVARAEAVLQTRRLVAPFTGTIGLPRVDPGSYISPGTIVATLQDLDAMRVDFSLPEDDLDELHIGQPIKVRRDVTGDNRRFSGKITGIDPRIDAASRMVRLRAHLESALGSLTPGQFVQVAVELPREEHVIALPQTAVMSSLYGDFVYIVRPREEKTQEVDPDAPKPDFLDGLVAKVLSGQQPATEGASAANDDKQVLEVVQVFVQTGRRSGGMIEVTGDNIKPGDEVVSSGQNRLAHGQKVAIDNTVTPDGKGQTPPEATAEPSNAAEQNGDAADAPPDTAPTGAADATGAGDAVTDDEAAQP